MLQYLYGVGERGEQNGVVEMSQRCESNQLEEHTVLDDSSGVSTISISILRFQLREIYFAN